MTVTSSSWHVLYLASPGAAIFLLSLAHLLVTMRVSFPTSWSIWMTKRSAVWTDKSISRPSRPGGTYVAVLRDVDYLIASRLHGTILGFVSQTPAVAISFDPKVDWVMEDLHQTDYLLHFQDFTAEDVLNAFDRLKVRRDAVVEQIASYRQEIFSAPLPRGNMTSLAGLALRHHQSHN